jgi:hypothetical protein
MINAYVIGDDAIAERLAGLPAMLADGLGRRLTRFARDLRDDVAGDRLAGGVLRRRSGRLADSLEIRDASTPNGPGLELAATAPYAGVQEYGFHGTESVAAHLRRIKQVLGRPIKAGAREVTVRAHVRRVDYPARSFLRAALDAMEDDFVQAMGEGVDEALREFAP